MKMNRWFALVVVVIMGFASGAFAQAPPPYGSPISLDVAKKAAATVSISGPAFRITKKVIQESLKKEVMETALKISQRLGFRERRGD
jgi:hypothetical protein